MYSVPTCAGSATSSDITDVWTTSSGISAESGSINSLDIYPVPTRDVLNLNIHSASFSDNNLVTIYDLAGRKITEHKIEIQEGRNNFSIALPGVAPGVYYLTLNGKDINFSKKVIIQ